MTSTLTDVPSPKVASAERAPATTCALVSSTPSSEMTLALPAPPPRDERTADVTSYDELKQQIERGFARAYWAGSRADEQRVQDETRATIRCIPLEQPEQAGRIKIGKLELAEKVIELPPAVPDDHAKLDTQDFGFYMTGPLSPLTSFIFDQAVNAGDELLVTVAASADGVVWSNDRSLEFRVVNGRLEPPREK